MIQSGKEMKETMQETGRHEGDIRDREGDEGASDGDGTDDDREGYESDREDVDVMLYIYKYIYKG